MPAPLARGIIITVSVLVAAGLAAYEHPQVREWIERTRHKIAMSFGDDVPLRHRSHQQMDASMQEEKTEAAETRRKQAIAEIMERGRLVQEARKRRRLSKDSEVSTPTFETLVDDNGRLRHDVVKEKASSSTMATAVEAQDAGSLRSRHIPIEDGSMHQSVDAMLPVRQLHHNNAVRSQSPDPFESRYEQEMRNAWNIPLSDRNIPMASSHASESLIDLTPTTEDAPDPDISIPSADYLHHPLDRSDYFSMADSRASSHTMSDREPEFYYAHQSPGQEPIESRGRMAPSHIDFSVSSAPSVADSIDHVHASEIAESEDMSDFGDGIRTPASAWTEVGSNISGEA